MGFSDRRLVRCSAAREYRWAGVAFLVLLGLAAISCFGPPAGALPSYARQTGQQCAACHNGFPELTPYGRLFKLNGYTFGGGQSDLPPVAAMVIPSFEHTDKALPAGAVANNYGVNDNADYTASLFYGGAITSNIGAFAQVTYDHTVRQLAWDNTDVRYANTTTLLGDETIYGVSVNNNPTVTDVWNSTPAWRFPFVSASDSLVPTPAAATLIEGGLAQQVVGATAYAFWNRLVYVEIGNYHTLSVRTDKVVGVDASSTSSNQGAMPYWRLAVEPKWGRHSLEVGTFGLAAALLPGRATGVGTDNLTDYGFDTQYQFLGERDAISLQASWIFENQDLTASANPVVGAASNTHDRLRSFNIKSSYYYQQTYGATLGYFNIMGTSDPAEFGGVSANNSPNSAGFIGELDYMPFSYGGPSFWPWLNVKLGAQYIYYTKFDGAAKNFDGAGTDARDNNTLLMFAWFAF